MAPTETAEPLEEASLVEDGEPELIGDAEMVSEPPVMALTQPPLRPIQAAMPTFGELTAEDREFVHRVFLQVKDVDWRSAPPPPPRKNLAGLDKKMQFLRDRVRELERDLARVGYVWSVKQAEIDAVEQIVAAKEAERSSAVQRYTQIRDQATAAATNHRAELEGFRGRVNKLESERAQLDKDLRETRANLSRETQEKTNLIAEFRAKIEGAQTAFNTLRDQSTRTIADLEGRLRATQEGLSQTTDERDQARTLIVERDATIGEQGLALSDREESLAHLSAQREEERRQAEAEAASAAEAHAIEKAELQRQHEQTLANLNAQLAEELRQAAASAQSAAEAYAKEKAEFEADHGRAVAELKAETEEKLRQATTAAQGAAEAHANQNAEIQTQLEQTSANLSERQQAVRELETALARTRDDATAEKAKLGASLGKAEDELRKAHESRLQITGRLAEREKTLLAVTDELSRGRAEHDERIGELKATIRAREGQIATLTAEIASARNEFTQLAQEYERHREEAGQISEDLGQHLADARAEARTAKDRLTQFEHDLADRDQQLSEALARIDEAKEQGRHQGEDAEGLKAKLTDLAERLSEAEQQATSARADVAELQTHLQGSDDELRLARSDSASAAQQIEELRQELATREASLVEAEATAQAAKEDARLAQADRDALGAQLAELQGSTTS